MYETGDELALQEIPRRKLNLKNRADEWIEQNVIAFAFDKPVYGQLRVCNELKKQALSVSAGMVRSIWIRHKLEMFKKRLKALQAKVAQENLIFSHRGLTHGLGARQGQKKEAHGEIKTEHPVISVLRTPIMAARSSMASDASTERPSLTVLWRTVGVSVAHPDRSRD